MATNDRYILTFADLLDHLTYSFQGAQTDAGLRDIKQAIHNAYRNLCFEHDWHFYHTPRLLVTSAPTDVTLTYTQSTNTVTVSTALSATVQGWIKYGALIVGTMAYPVKDLLTSTTFSLDDNYRPAADVASTTGKLVQYNYPFAGDFRSLLFVMADSPVEIVYERPATVEWWRRWAGGGIPVKWTIYQNMEDFGGFSVALYPYPQSSQNIQYVYQRAPRLMRYAGNETNSSAGTVAISTPTAVVGTGTSFDASMIGSVLRVSSNTTSSPTGLSGGVPYSEQQVITAVADTTHCTVSPGFTGTYSGVKYRISDPVDVWQGMQTALLRGCEKELAIARDKGVDSKTQIYMMELRQAMANDNIARAQVGELGSGGYNHPYGVSTNVGVV
jgi:hypothetical protein